MTFGETMREERVSSILEEVGQRHDKIDCPGDLAGKTMRRTLSAGTDEIGLTVTVTEVEGTRLTVTLNERDGTFDYNKARTSTEWEAGLTEDGFKFGGAMEWHTGKRVEKSGSFQFGGLNRSSTDGDDPVVSTDPVHRTNRIKDPLFAWLQPHGWSHKGLFGELFARRGVSDSRQ